MTQPSPFKWFKSSPEIIRLAVMLYVRFPLSLRNVEDQSLFSVAPKLSIAELSHTLPARPARLIEQAMPSSARSR